MDFIPFVDGALAVVEWGSDASQWTNTLWFKQLSPSAADYIELADFLHDHFGTEMAPEFWDNFYLRQVTVYDMQTALGSVNYDTRDPVACGKTGSGSPLSVACVCTFYTGSRGRSARGRNYLTGFIETDTGADEIVTSSVVENIQDAYSDLIDAVQIGTDFYWVVASHYSEKLPREEVLAIDISSAEVRNAKFGSQRRRIIRP